MPPRQTLLFVDDEASVLELLRRMFEHRFDVVCASTGEEALTVLRSRKVDLLLTDQRMPEMTGIELVKQARVEGFDVTAILLTAYTEPPDLIAAINEVQIYRYVTKPWDVADLTMTVKNALQFVQLRDEKNRLLESLRKRVEALSVLYEVSRTGAREGTLDALIERLLLAVGRVLPHEASAVLLDAPQGRNATLKISCRNELSEKALLHVKDSVLTAHRKTAGVLLPEDRVLTRLSGSVVDAPAAADFRCSLSVPLTAESQIVGTLSLFSSRPNAFSADDGELLDLLANQTTDVISTLRAAERESRRRLEQMVAALTDGVVLFDEKNEIAVINPAAKELLGAESTAQTVREKLGFSPFEMVRSWELGGKKVFRDQIALGEKTVHLTVCPVSTESGTFDGVALVLRDVTEQKRLEDRKDEFVSMVSHELRTPLASITGAIDLVTSQIAGEINLKQRRFLDMARESTDKLNTLVDDLLDLSKFAEGKMRMSFDFTPLDEVVRHAVERYGPAFTERRIYSRAVVPAAVAVVADAGRINQVLNNLLTNAVKFSREGGEVTVTLHPAPHHAVITIDNTGEPIGDSDLERIFDRFEQAQSRKTRAVQGTGLGLSICRNIVEAHGGRIWAEPVTFGARFVVVLPSEPPEKIVETVPHEVPDGSVLLVEDDPALAYVLKSALISNRFRVMIASSGEEALALARKLRPEVAALDMELPDIEGLKLLDIFRHDPDTRNTRVLAIAHEDLMHAATRSGASAFLFKPVASEMLVASVQSMLKARARPRGSVLIVDDDPQIRAICVEVLLSQGFDARQAGSVAEARTMLKQLHPSVLLLDVTLSDGDGFDFFEELKAERASSPMSVIFVSARGETSAKVRALKLGVDDYLTKPFDALELGARVESVLRRRNDETSSPTTLLPGSSAIEREVQKRFQAKQPFAFCYLDLDNLKAYNDFYGFAKADGVVRQTGDLLREIFTEHSLPSDFLGHVAGDDFVFITSPQSADTVCGRIIEAFDRIIPLYYEKVDRERGYIEAEDRFGERRRFPVMSVSIVAVMSDGIHGDHATLALRAAEMKKRAKGIVGSVYLRSDRSDPVKSRSA